MSGQMMETLSNFKDKHRVLGVTPEIGKLAIERGIPTIIDYFNKDIASKIVSEYGQAKLNRHQRICTY